MKKASFILLVACALCGCEKLEVETADILGTWVEEHSDYPFYAPEGNVYWTFYVPEDSTSYFGDGLAQISYHDATEGDKCETKSYFIGSNPGKNYLYFNSHRSDDSGAIYIIEKLSKNKMTWRKRWIAPSTSRKVEPSDYKYFVRTSDKK